MSAAQPEDERARVVDDSRACGGRHDLFLSRAGGDAASTGRQRHRAARQAGGLWRRLVRRRRRRSRRQSQDHPRPSRPSAAFAKTARLHRLAGALHAHAPRHGAAARDAGRRRRRTGSAAHALSRERRGAQAIDADAREGARGGGRRRRFRQESACRSRRLFDRRHRRAHRRGRAGGDRRAAGADRAAARSSLRRAGVGARAAGGRKCVDRGAFVAGVQAVSSRRRHRLGQDRSLFRGDRRGPSGWRTGARHDAGNCAHDAISRAFRSAFRREARRMAFRRQRAQTRAHLARLRDRRRARRRRRAVGAVPALFEFAADRRRRGTRRRLQTGRRRQLSRARHGGGARADGAGGHRSRLGDAVDRNARQRHARTLRLSKARFAGARAADANARSDRHAQGRPAARPMDRATARSGGRRNHCARRAGAALSQSARLCAVDGLPDMRPSLPLRDSATPGWSNIAFAAR